MTSPLVTTTSMNIGPSLSGTVVTKNADMVVAAYLGSLDLQIVSDAPLSSSLATAWGKPSLTGHRLVVLGADPTDANTHWLRVLEIPDAVRPVPMRQRGWLALEILVRDVRALGRRLAKGPFTVLGEPRPLAFSNDLWAMQVAGPAGETLYLTEVRAPVPPFSLPEPATLTAERLFIPVLSALDRETSMCFYEALNGNTGLRFETRVSALNNALGIDPERQRPVGTLQLAGSSLIEIDQVPEHSAARPIIDELPAGLAMVSFEATKGMSLPPGVNWHEHRDPRWPRTAVALLQGAAGEWVELLAPSVGAATNSTGHLSSTGREGDDRNHIPGERT